MCFPCPFFPSLVFFLAPSYAGDPVSRDGDGEGGRQRLEEGNCLAPPDRDTDEGLRG